MGDEDSILQYEIVNASEMINGVRGNRYSASIKVEGQRQSIESGGFWCCQNVIDEGWFTVMMFFMLFLFFEQLSEYFFPNDFMMRIVLLIL